MASNRWASGCVGYRASAGMNRRAFLKVGTLSALGLSLAQYAGLRQAQAATPARAKSVLLIYTMGGISHHDSFDPKPEAPAEIRGEFSTVSTRVPGVRFSEHVPRLAGMADRFALIRSMQHQETDHGVGAYYMLRGYPQAESGLDLFQKKRAHPTTGAHVYRLLGSRDGLPAYIVVPGTTHTARMDHYTAGWMGRAFDPFILGADPNQPAFDVPGLSPRAEIPAPRLGQRASLSRQMDRQSRLLESSPGAQSMGTSYERAFQVLSARSTRAAFDIRQEPDRVRDAYGRTRLGQSCLLARRLVEAEVPFVTVDDDGWDHHSQVFQGLRQRLPELDRCLPALLTDLEERGLLGTTLVMLLTDFGRTPRVNQNAGRDHWPGVFSVILAGAGIRGGQVIGASDASGALPKEGPITPKDLAATLYSFLGINPFQEYHSRDGRPFRVLDTGQVIPQLVS
jgi:uncharacterized protein (DUF1501 family)